MSNKPRPTGEAEPPNRYMGTRADMAAMLAREVERRRKAEEKVAEYRRRLLTEDEAVDSLWKQTQGWTQRRLRAEVIGPIYKRGFALIQSESPEEKV